MPLIRFHASLHLQPVWVSEVEAERLVRSGDATYALEPVEMAVFADEPPGRAVISRAQSARPARAVVTKGESDGC